MQPPTCAGIRIRSVHDAHVVFHAVYREILPMVTRRLDTEERRAVCAGNVYVWEERGRNTEATGLGIERWTDGIRWSASRVRDEFLLYHERDSGTEFDSFTDSELGASYRLVKQTYSVFVETPSGRRKWHLTAYFVPATVNQLRTVDDIPSLLANAHPPEGMYTSAKMGKGRARGEYYPTDIHS
ncbi:Gti1/Pac2 family-domain-containing protein, partial [Phellopilus nigrolimitatus]